MAHDHRHDRRVQSLQSTAQHADDCSLRRRWESLSSSAQHASNHRHDRQRESLRSTALYANHYSPRRQRESLSSSAQHAGNHLHDQRGESLQSTAQHANHYSLRRQYRESSSSSAQHASSHRHDHRRKSLPSTQQHANHHRPDLLGERLPSSAQHAKSHRLERWGARLPSLEQHTNHHGHEQRGESSLRSAHNASHHRPERPGERFHSLAHNASHHHQDHRGKSLPSSGRHTIHPDHDLQRKTDKEYYRCNGCKMPGFGLRYSCKQCSFKFNLHEKCFFSRKYIPPSHHEFVENSTFKFLYKLPHICKGGKCDWCHRRCQACAKPTEGFVYFCEGNGIAFHPICFNLRSKLCTNDKYRIEFELSSNQSFSKCLLCKRKQVEGSVTGNEGWTYVSKCEKYTFHVFCSMKLMVEKREDMSINKGKDVELSLVLKDPKVPGEKNRNIILEIACSFLEILLGILLGDPISSVLGLVGVLKPLLNNKIILS